MDLFEYQAKELFAKHGVPVTRGTVALTASDAKAAAEQYGGTVVVKAQVKTGGRGKAGGVKLASSPEDAEAKANGFDVKTLRQVIRLRKQDSAERQEAEALLDLYMQALGMVGPAS